jgi:hypothetical protein
MAEELAKAPLTALSRARVAAMWSALEPAGPTGALYESAVCVEAHIGELQTGGIACRGLFAFGRRDLLAVAELGAEAPHAINMYDIALCKPLSELFAKELEYAFNFGA